MRPKAQARFMMAAEFESMWSTCLWLQVGTVYVDDEGTRLASAYNGAPYGQPHCNMVPRERERCDLCCHSETNGIDQAAKNGIKLGGSHAYVLYRPCSSCAKNMVQARISSIFYRHDYDSDGKKDYVMQLFRSSGIYVQKLPVTDEENSFSLHLSSWKKTWNGGSQDTSSVLKFTGL